MPHNIPRVKMAINGKACRPSISSCAACSIASNFGTAKLIVAIIKMPTKFIRNTKVACHKVISFFIIAPILPVKRSNYKAHTAKRPKEKKQAPSIPPICKFSIAAIPIIIPAAMPRNLYIKSLPKNSYLIIP